MAQPIYLGAFALRAKATAGHFICWISQSAIASVKQAQADLKLAYVRSPIAGRILKIHTKAGENIDTEGIADIGPTDQMWHRRSLKYSIFVLS